VSRWSELEARPARSLLDTPDPLADWAVLRAASFGHPAFQPVRQTLEWDLHDEAGAVLTLELPYTGENQHAIDRIEALQEIPEETLLVARVRRTPTGLVGEPLSLVYPAGTAGAALDPLHFGKQEKPIKRAVEPATQNEGAAAWLPPQLEDLRSWLTSQAERGTGAAAPGALTATLASRHQALRAVGFTSFPAAPDPDPAIGILRSNYLLLQTVQVLTGLSG
jgi:hypothetical protein